MHDAAARQMDQFGIEVQQSVLQSPCTVACAGMHYEPWRLVDDEDVLVLMHDLQIDGLGSDFDRFGQRRRNFYAFTAQYLVLGPQLRAIDQNLPGLNPV